MGGSGVSGVSKQSRVVESSVTCELRRPAVPISGSAVVAVGERIGFVGHHAVIVKDERIICSMSAERTGHWSEIQRRTNPDYRQPHSIDLSWLYSPVAVGLAEMAVV